MEKHVLNNADRDAGVSTRQVGEELSVPHMAIWRVLHEHLLYPYHLKRVQSLMPADFPAQENFFGVVFNEVFSISFLHRCSLQMWKISVGTVSSIFKINTSG
jgi:hypothetical protein